MTQADNSKLVTIFGGSGFIGSYAVQMLARQGWRVRAAVRRPDLAGHLQPMGIVGQIHAVQANIRFPDSVERACRGAQAVVSLVGTMTPAGRQTYEALHVAGARAVARAARAAGAERLVHISALGADPRARSRYARTKAAGETAVLEEFPGAIIFRPSLVFGPEDQFFNRFAALARVSPILPLFGGGKTRLQPVYVGDVGRAVANAVEGQGVPGLVYELGGPEVLTLRTILDKTLEWSGRQRAYLPVPFWLAKLLALITLPLPSALRPLTMDQVRLLQRDNVVSAEAISGGRTLAGLGIPRPQAVGAIVPWYLERFKPRGQFAHYRG